MKGKTSIPLQLLTLLLVFSFACNQVKETPEPDRFATQELLNIRVQADGGSAYLNVLEENQITSEVTVRFDPPKNGRISMEASEKRFKYLANVGFNGKETIQYELCKTGNCKKGDISIEVRNNHDGSCRPTFSSDSNLLTTLFPDTHRTFSFPTFPGDQYCPENTLSLLGPGNPDFQVSIAHDSIRVRLKRQILEPTQFPVSFQVCDQDGAYTNCLQRNRTFRVEIPASYCDAIFRVESRGDFNPLLVDSGQDTIKVSANTFFFQIHSCRNEIDPGFFEVATSNSLGVLKKNGLYYVFKNPANHSPRILYYSYRNIRGIKKTGWVRVNFL